MDIEKLRTLALSFKAATEDIKWEEHLCFSVADKIFLITSPDEVPIKACFKVSEEDFETLCSRSETFGQAAHFAKRKWVVIKDINNLSPKEWKHYLQCSYDSVVSKLTKKLRAEMDL
ncbi:MAG: MmcQ/YjbR family DNA-binding protein [Phycisphaerales bacterium]|nr:MmcQ/YjbR family DNA-binding protein [Phycisphaerales bacterium]